MEQSPLKREQQKTRIKDMRVKVASPDNPTILIEGVLYGARYLGSTQLSTEGRPSKSLRMMQVNDREKGRDSRGRRFLNRARQDCGFTAAM